MAITPLPTPPTRSDPATFAERGDAFLGALPTFQTEANELAEDVNAKQQATAADRVQTGADRVQTGLDKTATAADRVQTGLDRVQTGADRVQTGLDRTAAATSAANAQASANNTANAVVDQLNGIKSQTEYARDQALAGLGAADNSQILAVLMEQLMYIGDLAGAAIKEISRAEAALTTRVNATEATVATYDAAITHSVQELTHVMDLAGVTARTVTTRAKIVAAPANASAAGTPGEVAYDSSYFYVCTALNTWKRSAIATW